MIYLDSNATTKVHPEVVEVMLPYYSEFYYNPSSGYKEGKIVKAAIDAAREQLAKLIGASGDEMIFTSGGTESNSMALRSLAKFANEAGKKTIITGEIEHSAVLRVCDDLVKEQGFKLVKIGVNEKGVYCLDELEKELASDDVGFVSLMLTNNETGVIQPIKEAAILAHLAKVPLHSDAIQAIGKLEVDVDDLGVDYLSISGHKFHAPKGVGALYVKKNRRVMPMLLGGGQERGLRSGTENVAPIVGIGKAAEIMMQYLNDEAQSTKTRQLRDTLYQLISAEVTGVSENGDVENRTTNTLHISIEGCEAAGMLILLNEYGVACSSGSACMTGKQQPSHVQKAMGYSDVKANSSLRLSLSLFTTEEEVELAAQKIIKAANKLRMVQGATGVGPVVVYT